jgi:phenylacetate-CoA ligase
MDPELRNAAILKRLCEVIDYAWSKAPFYRSKWLAAGFQPGDVKSLEDFSLLPVVTKEELRLAQLEHPPFGNYLCVPVEEVVRVHGTSGTTGRPTAFGISRTDWQMIAEGQARAMWAMSIRPRDTVFIGSVFSLYMGSWGALLGAERLGATAFPFGAGVAGQSLRAVSWIAQMKPTVFYGTPSYALRLAEVAAENGYNPLEFGIAKLCFSGEPGASIPSIRNQIKAIYGGEVFDAGSMAEMSPWAHLAESSSHQGMLCWQDIVYTEVCDPPTLRPVPFGGEGTPVYTHLERVSQPMIRLLSGDLTRWEAGPSDCGRTYPILPRGIYGRIDDQFTVRGENINPSAINEILFGDEGYAGEHRIIISRQESMDTLAVQVECNQEIYAAATSRDLFASRIAEELRRNLGVTTRVVVLPPNSLERTEFKARRVIDERDLFREVAGRQ